MVVISLTVFKMLPKIHTCVDNRKAFLHMSVKAWDDWVAQLTKCLTLDFSLGHDLTIVRSSPPLGTMLGIDPA